MDFLVAEVVGREDNIVVSYKNNDRSNHRHCCLARIANGTCARRMRTFGTKRFTVRCDNNQMVHLYVCRSAAHRDGVTNLGLLISRRQQGNVRSHVTHIHNFINISKKLTLICFHSFRRYYFVCV